MSLDVTGVIEGADALDKALEEFGRNALEVSADLLQERGEAIMADSKENYVPVKWGVLQGSGHVEQPVVEAGTVSVRLAYGGPAEAYAIRQHEELTWVHPKQGCAKYLERPWLAGIRGLADWIGEGIRRRLGT